MTRTSERAIAIIPSNKGIMHYCTALDSPQSCVMDINGGGGSSKSSFSVAMDTVPSSDHSPEDSLLHSTGHSMNIVETSQPYSHGECYFPVHGGPPDEFIRPELLSRMSTWAVPSLWSDLNFPVQDFLSGSPGASWSSGLGDHYMRQYVSAQKSLCCSPTKRLQYSLNGTREAKRLSRLVEPNAPQLKLKKSRSTLTHPALKGLQVRKEKLGDRIAALQQLVAPYGKTDTASVLSESIGYIKFLQDQVEALSLPYMKRSHAWTAEKSNEVLIREENDGSVEAKGTELRRLGLCLVPLSCLSHIDFDNCGGPIFNWPFPRGP